MTFLLKSKRTTNSQSISNERHIRNTTTVSYENDRGDRQVRTVTHEIGKVIANNA
jgi:hypothetical protein